MEPSDVREREAREQRTAARYYAVNEYAQPIRSAFHILLTDSQGQTDWQLLHLRCGHVAVRRLSDRVRDSVRCHDCFVEDYVNGKIVPLPA